MTNEIDAHKNNDKRRLRGIRAMIKKVTKDKKEGK